MVRFSRYVPCRILTHWDFCYEWSAGEPIVEPEVDLSTFLERQRISDADTVLGAKQGIDEDEVDMTLAHISSKPTRLVSDRKGKVQEIEWDRELDEMTREKAVAEAQRGASHLSILTLTTGHSWILSFRSESSVQS